MSESDTGTWRSLQDWVDGEQRYVVMGAVSAIIAVVIIPLFGLLAIYSGYKLYTTQQRLLVPATVSLVGGVGLLNWIVYLVTL